MTQSPAAGQQPQAHQPGSTDVFDRWESNIRGYCRVYPTVFKSASNARQVDEHGKSYIDFFSGAGVLNFGHNNPRMKQAVIDFIESDGVTHSLDTYTTVKRTFIERFVETVLQPRGMDYKLQFTGPTGTNAVEAALKLARKVTGRTNVIAFTHGFHGMTLGSLSATANSYFREAAGVPLEHVTRLPFETAPGGGVQELRDYRCALADSSSGLHPPAAVLLEAVQAEGGVHVASEEWLKEAQKLAHENGALLIVDDIQAGCGRTGSYFSFDGMDIQPDIICLAKGIGGFGTPLAMNLLRPEHDIWSPGEHTGTFRGQGISFVAGTVALSYFEDDSLMSNVKKCGDQMRSALLDIQKRHPGRTLDVRGKGMIWGLDLYDSELAKAITRKCFESGLLVGPCGTGGRIIKLIPPITIPGEDLTAGLDIFAVAVHEVVGNK